MEYPIAKGVFDILPVDPDPNGKWRESHLWHYLETQIRELASKYGYREMRTPLFELSALFTRSIGKESDIVSKEMYTFEDKGGRKLALRPEGTAPAMRAFIEKGLHQIPSARKFFYMAPMFRYERQQAGRYRQHHQFGIEALGCSGPEQDVEVIDLLYTLLKRLGLNHLTLHLNSIGEGATRERYNQALCDFLTPHLAHLSKESQERFHTNRLRILDSKDAGDQSILQHAPRITDFLDEASQQHFESVQRLLSDIGIPYRLNPFLVRGLDYYNRTVFEVTVEGIGSQNSLGGGGRYDGLLKELHGPDLPACGFGAGLERILQALLLQKIPFPEPERPQLFLIALGEGAKQRCFKLMTQLRHKGLFVEMELTGKKLKAALRFADELKARFVVIMGEEELQSGRIELKEMETGIGKTIVIDELGGAFDIK